MKNKFLLLTWLLAVPLLWGGCDKPLFKTDEASFAQPDKLPPVTTTGEGTFQCVVVDDNCSDTIYITEERFDYDWAN
jgi:hypothetical protein